MQYKITDSPIVKFSKRSAIESMISGNIWFRTLAAYRKLEEEKGDTVLGDKFEAMWHVQDAIFKVPEIGICQHVHDKYFKTKHMNDYAFCALSMRVIDGKFQFDDEQKRKLPQFGDTAMLILKPEKFFERISKTLEKNWGISAKLGIVNYYDENIDSMNIAISLMNAPENIAFWKRKDYGYQSELRIVIPQGSNTDEIFKISIGDISDIAEIVDTSEMLKLRL